MKLATKFALSILLTLFATLNAMGQLTYTRSVFSGAYSAIDTASGATPIHGGTTPSDFSTSTGTANVDDGTAYIPLPFNFTYAGTTYFANTNFLGVCTNGFAYFSTVNTNASKVTSFSNSYLYTTTTPNATLAPYWDDLRAYTATNGVTGSVMYQTTGSSGSQVLTIQWTSYPSYWTGNARAVNFQIKLYEGTNSVEFWYGPVADGTLPGGSSSESASIGIENATGGNGEYIDAVTGSSFTNNGMVTTNKWPKRHYRFIPSASSPIIGGTYTVGVGQTYESLSDAVADLNHRGISGPVTLNLTDAIYDTSASNGGNIFPILLGPVAGTSSTNTITIEKTSGTATLLHTGTASGNCGNQATTTAVGTLNEPIFGFVGVDYVTLRNVTITSNGSTGADRGILVMRSSATDGATNNTFRDISITLNRSNTSSIAIEQSTSTTPTSALGTSSNNKYYNLTIQNVYAGIYLQSNSTTLFDDACEIGTTLGGTTTIGGSTANDIGNGTSQTWGIRANGQSNLKIFNCEIRNITGTSTSAVDGIFIDNLGSTTTSLGTVEVFNNVVHDLKSTSASSTSHRVSGIRVNLTGNASSVSRVYNNFVYALDNNSTNTTARQIIGIYAQDAGSGVGATHNIDFNSVRLEPTGLSCSNACFEIGTTSGPTMNVRNNAFANFTPSQTGSAKHYAVVTTATSSIGPSGSTWNRNVYHIANLTNGFVGLTNVTDRATLADWQGAVSQDANSRSQNPQFISATNLHISSSQPTPVESAGSYFSGAITWVSTDIDGEARNGTTPDIGADEGTFQPLYDNDVSASALVSPANGAIVLAGSTINPSATFANPGLNNQTNVPVRFKIQGPSPSNTEVYNQTATISTLNAGQSSMVTFPSTSISTEGTYTMTASAELVGDENTANDALVGSFTVKNALSGDYTIGVSLFNKLTGRNITHQMFTRRILKPVANERATSKNEAPSEDDTQLLVSIPVSVENGRAKIASPRPGSVDDGKVQWLEVEEQYGILTENGKPYDGPQFVWVSDQQKQELGLSPNLVGVYTTITAALNDFNTVGLAGPTNFLLIDATFPSETLPLVVAAGVNVPTATNTLTIRPNTGVTSTISGSSTSGIFNILSPYVILDGDNVGGSVGRDLAISNTLDATNTYTIGLFNAGTPYIPQNVTIRNCNISAGSTGGSNAIFGIALNASGGDYDNIVIENNLITKVLTGIEFAGVSGFTADNGQIIGNTIGSTTDAQSCYGRGILVSQADNLLIQRNEIIGQVVGNTLFSSGTATSAKAGIILFTGTTNAKLRRNNIHDFFYNGTSGFGAFGIVYGPGTTTNTGTTEISNNMIYNIKGDGDDELTSPGFMGWLPQGICIYNNGTAGVQIYFNSIHMSGAVLGSTFDGSSACIGVANTVGTGSIDIRNNILRNSMTPVSGPNPSNNETMGIWVAGSGSTNAIFSNINWNNYDGTGGNLPQVGYLNNFSTSLSGWQTATGQDANSKSFNTDFFSTTNLHLNVSGVNHNYDGQPIGGITIDFDGDTRDASAPYIGADEVPAYPLPITLASFTARINPNGAGVLLEWQTVSELNNYGFYVQRRRDGEQMWTEIPGSFVPGHGTTTEPQYYSYVDNTLTETGLYHYRLRQQDLDGTSHFTPSISIEVTSLTSVEEVAPRVFQLLQNYPNPFNPTTTIKFSVETTAPTTLELYNVLGQKVATLFDEVAEAGKYYRVKVDGSSLASGMYLYRLHSGDRHALRKLLLLK